MPKNDDLLAARPASPEAARLESALRPASLDEFVGQAKLKDNLKVFIQAARGRKEPLDHCLFIPPRASARLPSPTSWRARWAST